MAVASPTQVETVLSDPATPVMTADVRNVADFARLSSMAPMVTSRSVAIMFAANVPGGKAVYRGFRNERFQRNVAPIGDSAAAVHIGRRMVFLSRIAAVVTAICSVVNVIREMAVMSGRLSFGRCSEWDGVLPGVDALCSCGVVLWALQESKATVVIPVPKE